MTERGHVLFLKLTRNTPRHTSRSAVIFAGVNMFSLRKMPDHIVPNTGIKRLKEK